MNIDDTILVAGYRGLVGGSILRRLEADGFRNILKVDKNEVDLCSQAAVDEYFEREKPDYLFLAAARVGGIHANNTYPADFIRDNLFIQTLVIDAAHKFGVKRLLFLGSSCIYPRFADQPIKEEYLLTGELEPTNEPYAIAKIAGVKMCQSYRRQFGFDAVCLMPTNLYGPGDNFDLENSHVLPALIRRFHEAKVTGAKQVTIWGSGKPMREFLYVEDLARAAVFLMNCDGDKLDEHTLNRLVNVGVGSDITIAELANIVRKIIYPDAELVFDTSMPDGTPRKYLDVSKLYALGWKPEVEFEDGIRQTYEWFRKNVAIQ